MINSIGFQGFKALSGLQFNTGKLTLLTGGNSVGKSSFIQALLLARAAALRTDPTESIPLNGPMQLALGSYLDVLTRNVYDAKSIKISISEGVHTYELLLEADFDAARYVKASVNFAESSSIAQLGSRSFQYLCAERRGPRDFESLSSVPPPNMGVGESGQHVAEFLNVTERDEVSHLLEHPAAAGQRLGKQVEAWMASLVHDLQIRVVAVPNIDVAAIAFKRGGISAEWDRPSNTGFGVSYSLPIVVCGLAAAPGAILIVESPEAHLHSSAQSKIGSFLARVAAAGVQVFVETHSEHILNGVRLAVARKDHPIQSADVAIHHMQRTEKGTKSTEITIEENGSLSTWPTEFFDQTEKDLAEIVRLQRR